MQAHRSLGECLLMTQKAQEKVAAGTAGRERDQLLLELVGRWQVVLRGLGSVGPASEEGTSDVAELEDVAALIGCRIAWAGQLPEDKAARSMVLSAVREALSNAARHARATALNVSCEQQDGWSVARIWDNGQDAKAGRALGSLTEGAGLADLRARIEEEGGVLRLDLSRGVALTVRVPEAG